ncbi:MAG: peptidoglycan DD-metalloendopeptidase family protein [Rhodospirillales bacterium]
MPARSFRILLCGAALAALAACARSGPPAPVTIGSTQPPAANAARTAAPATPIAPGSAYIVRDGDTLFTVARRAGVPTRALIDANRLNPPYALEPGTRLSIPNVNVHEVRPGDTVSQLAQRYGVPMRELVRANAIEPPYTIRIGQRLVIPQTVRPETVRNVAQAPSSPSPPAVVAVSPAPPPQAVVSNPAAAPPPPTLPTAPAAPAVSPPTPAPQSASVPPAAAPVPPPVPANPPAAPAGSDTAVSAGRMLWPVRGGVTSDFGPKPGGLQNDGVNIAAPRGTPFRAAESGVVIYAGNELRGFGNLLLLRHEGGIVTAYAHADELLVQRGDQVRRGQTIGRVGATGNVTTPQLHFEVRRGTRAVNPIEFLGSVSAAN